MQKKVAFLLVALCCVTSFAQNTDDENVIVRPRITYEDLDHAEISASKHLTFEGIPINGSIDSFVKRLQAKGFDMYEQGDNLESVSGTIPIDSIREMYVNILYDQTNKSVFGVRSSFDIPCGEDYETPARDVVSKLDGMYVFQVEDNNIFENEGGLSTLECQKYILDDSKQYYLGSITVDLCSSQTGFHTIAVEYKDAYNTRQQNKLIDGIFDLSRYMDNNYFDGCKMGVYENILLFTATEQGKEVSFYAADNDRDNLLDFLYDKEIDEDFKRFVLNTYIYTGVKQQKQSQISVCYQNMFQKAVEHYYDIHKDWSPYTAQNNHGNTQSTARSMSPSAYFWHTMVGSRIFSGEEQKAFTELGIYPWLMDMIPKIGSMAGGGSTQWDSYNDAQKAVIHEHDNAK